MIEEIRFNEKYNCSISNMGYIIRNTGVISMPTKRKDTGYYVVFDGNESVRRIHRMVAETFLDNPNNLTDVNHKDGDKSHNSVDNLEWCDRRDNIKHAYDTGLREIKRGADSPNTKLTLEDAQYIYDHYQTDGYNSNTKELAEQFALDNAKQRHLYNYCPNCGSKMGDDE